MNNVQNLEERDKEATEQENENGLQDIVFNEVDSDEGFTTN